MSVDQPIGEVYSLDKITCDIDPVFVSTHLKRVACLNRTATVHPASDISDEVVAHMYHDHVQPVHHDESCGHPEHQGPPQGP